MDLSSLESAVKAREISLDSIEGLITISTVLVVVGLVIEYWFPLGELIELIKKRPPIPWKKLMEMTGGVLVTVGVAGELWFQSRASSLQTFIRSDSHQIEGILNKEAGDARDRAGKADERAANAEKATEDERMARVQLEKLVAWRTITESKQKEIGSRLKKYPGVRIAFTINAGDPEGFAFGAQIAAIAIEAGWDIIAFAPVTNLGRFKTGVTITTTGDANTRDASDALTGELKRLKFDAVRSPEIDPRATDPLKRPLMYVFVQLRPQAIPNKVSSAIAAQK